MRTHCRLLIAVNVECNSVCRAVEIDRVATLRVLAHRARGHSRLRGLCYLRRRVSRLGCQVGALVLRHGICTRLLCVCVCVCVCVLQCVRETVQSLTRENKVVNSTHKEKRRLHNHKTRKELSFQSHVREG